MLYDGGHRHCSQSGRFQPNVQDAGFEDLALEYWQNVRGEAIFNDYPGAQVHSGAQSFAFHSGATSTIFGSISQDIEVSQSETYVLSWWLSAFPLSGQSPSIASLMPVRALFTDPLLVRREELRGQDMPVAGREWQEGVEVVRGEVRVIRESIHAYDGGDAVETTAESAMMAFERLVRVIMCYWRTEMPHFWSLPLVSTTDMIARS